jgi:hypothetical protein
MDGVLFDTFVYLCAAVIAVPVAKRLGLGSVLGYLIAGIVIGPLLGIVGSETEQLQHFAEFGVVMMLFLVGLELRPQMLWEMRARLLGLGGLQVVATALLIAARLGPWGRTGVRPLPSADHGAVVNRHRATDPERKGADRHRGRPSQLRRAVVPRHRRDSDAGTDPAAGAAGA